MYLFIYMLKSLSAISRERGSPHYRTLQRLVRDYGVESRDVGSRGEDLYDEREIRNLINNHVSDQPGYRGSYVESYDDDAEDLKIEVDALKGQMRVLRKVVEQHLVRSAEDKAKWDIITSSVDEWWNYDDEQFLFEVIQEELNKKTPS